MAAELNAGLACEQGLKKGFAARRAAVPNVVAIKAQEIEGVIDESRLGALTIGSDEKG
jgi:hypothetical protein